MPQARRRAVLAAVALVWASGAVCAEETRPTLRFGTLWYLSGQHVESGESTSDDFLVKRGHLDLFMDIAPGWSARLTPDVTVDTDGDVEAPVKFAFVEARLGRLGALVSPYVQAGRVPTPWIGFEEGIYRYRMQDGTFMDRLGFFASADEGIVAGALLGSGLPEAFADGVRPAFPGRWGSFAAGVYSGSGFKTPDRNDSYVVQGRLSVRPLPDALPGLQVSAVGVTGEGNTAAEPDWSVAAAMASLESRRAVATVQWTDNRGVQSGAWVDGNGDALPGVGWSAFIELRQGPGPGWAAFARHDWYDRDTAHAGGRSTRTIAGVARHLRGGSAVLLDYETLQPEEAGRPSTNRVQLTAQLRLAPVPVLRH